MLKKSWKNSMGKMEANKITYSFSIEFSFSFNKLDLSCKISKWWIWLLGKDTTILLAHTKLRCLLACFKHPKYFKKTLKICTLKSLFQEKKLNNQVFNNLKLKNLAKNTKIEVGRRIWKLRSELWKLNLKKNELFGGW